MKRTDPISGSLSGKIMKSENAWFCGVLEKDVFQMMSYNECRCEGR